MNDMQLNRALAERLGWRMEYDADHTRFKLWFGDVYVDYFNGNDLDAAWADALEEQPVWGQHDYERAGSAIPRWSQDEGAALRLCLDVGKPRGWLITITCDGSWCAFVKNQPMGFGLHGDQPVTIDGKPLTSEAPTAARALAELALRAIESGAGG